MRVPGLLPILFALLGLAACGDAPVEQGGSGTDAGNVLTARVVSPSGEAVPDAVVEIRSSAEVSPSGGSAPAYRAISDARGEARFRLPRGTWSLRVRSGSSGSWRESILAGSEVDTLAPVSHLSGLFRGAAGMHVAIPGMGVSADCDSSGAFAIDSLPPGSLPLLVMEGNRRRDSTRIELPAGTAFQVGGAIDSLPPLFANHTETTN